MIKNKKKIILIGPLPPPYYGHSISFEFLSKYLQSKYNTITINYSSKHSKPGSGFNLLRFFEYILIFIKYFSYLKKNQNNDIVYITVAQSFFGFLRDCIFINLAYIYGYKIIAHLKGGNFDNFFKSQNNFIKNLIKNTYRKVNKIIVLGISLKKMFYFDERLKDKILIVNNGLPFEIIKKDNQFEINKTIEIIYLSNLIISKGYFDLLKALKILKEQKINFKARFYGEFMNSPDDNPKISISSLRKNFFKFISDNNLEDNVYYCGVVNGENKIKVLKNSDIFVLPTNYINEGQPVSIIEAMATKNVIITTKFRSIIDIIDEHIDGNFVEYNSPKQIFNLIKKYNDNRSLAIEFKKNAYDKFLNKFTKKQHLKNIESAIID